MLILLLFTGFRYYENNDFWRDQIEDLLVKIRSHRDLMLDDALIVQGSNAEALLMKIRAKIRMAVDRRILATPGLSKSQKAKKKKQFRDKEYFKD